MHTEILIRRKDSEDDEWTVVVTTANDTLAGLISKYLADQAGFKFEFQVRKREV